MRYCVVWCQVSASRECTVFISVTREKHLEYSKKIYCLQSSYPYTEVYDLSFQNAEAFKVNTLRISDFTDIKKKEKLIDTKLIAIYKRNIYSQMYRLYLLFSR